MNFKYTFSQSKIKFEPINAMKGSNDPITIPHGCVSTSMPNVHQVHVMHGKIDPKPRQTNWNHGWFSENYRKSMKACGKSMNTLENRLKHEKNGEHRKSMNIENGN